MSVNTSTIETIERLDRQRSRSLACFLGTFLFWSLCWIAISLLHWILGAFGPEDALWLLPLTGIPTILWLFFLLRYRSIQYKIKSDPEVAAVLNDEMVRYAWLRAASLGFWSMLAVEAIPTIGLAFINSLHAFIGTPDLSALYGIQSPLAVTVGVSVTICAYLHARRD